MQIDQQMDNQEQAAMPSAEAATSPSQQQPILTGQAAPQAVDGQNTEAAAPSDGQTVPADEQTASQQGLTVRFNHETRTLTREQAVQLAQKGLKYEAVAPLIQGLQQAAQIRGIPPAQLAEEWRARADAVVFADAVARCGGNEQTARRLLESERALAARRASDAVTDRLAAEFLELQRQVPQVASLDDVPQQVLETAAGSGLPLLDAYLRHLNREQQHIRAARDASQKASAGALGALTGLRAGDEAPEIAAMRRGIMGR